jgi:hypothetical protein
MANFAFRIVLEPHPWPFSWGPWGRFREVICREMDDDTITIWQRDGKEDGMGDEPMVVECFTGRSTCTTAIMSPTMSWEDRKLLRRTRL